LTHETVLQTVSQTPGAVSYLGFAYLSNPNIVAFAIDNVKPTREDIQNGSWPIQAPGFSITKGQPSDLEAALLGYVLSSGFQNSAEFARRAVSTMRLARVSGVLAAVIHSSLLRLIDRGNASKYFSARNAG
jgi:ABC-type phosphate transport system substrate-binding protein